MSLKPGQSPKGDAQMTETRTAAETLSPGDGVALDADDHLVRADDTNTLYGVVGYGKDGSDYADGDLVKITTAGPVVANMAADVAGGVEVTGTTTAGQLGSGTGARGVVTMYTEGEAGDNNVPSIDAGYGYVWI